MSIGHLDEQLLTQIIKRVMFDSVTQETDMSNPKARYDLVHEVTEAIVGSTDSELVEKYVQAALSHLYKESETRGGGTESYYRRMGGAKNNELKNAGVNNK